MTINRYIPLYSTESSAAPSASDLYVGELAVNVTDGAIYTRNTADQIVLLTPRVVTSASWSSGSISSSYALSASYATSASWAPGAFDSTVNRGYSGSLTGSLIGTASYANTSSYLNTTSGSDIGHIQLRSPNGALTSSYLYQDGNRSLIIGATASVHSGAPTKFVVDAGVTDSYNLVHAHGDINSYLQILGANRATGSNASIDFVAQNDIGDENGGYIDMGINSSNFNDPNFVGGPTDAYLYNTGSDLYIGNASPDKSVYFFNGGPNAGATTRMYFDATGTVGINTTTATAGAPEALIVYGLPTGQYNLITGVSNVDLYAQFNIHNLNGGPSASSDIVATADYGNEDTGYIDLGINSSNYTWEGWPGRKFDAYLLSRAYGDLIIGANSDIPYSGNIVFFAGNDYHYHPLILGATGSHTMSGSLNVLNGAITASRFVGTASQAISSSWALTASYVDGEITSASFAESASFVLTASYALTSAGAVINAQTASITWYVSGSGTGSFTGSLTGSATTAVSASFVSGAYTAGWARTTDTASFVSGAYTAQWAKVADSSSFVSGAYTSKWALSASYAPQTNYSSGTFTGSVTGNLLGTSSWASSASFVSAAYVAGWARTTDTASFVSGAYTAQWAQTVQTASFVSGAYTAQWARTTDSASFVSASYVSKWAQTTDTASFVSGAYTSQWALSASAATSITFLPASASYAGTSWNAINNIPVGIVSSSTQYNTGSYTGSVTGNLLGTSSWANSASFVSGAYTAQWARTTDSASFVSGAYTAQWAKVADSSSFVSGAYTAQWSKTTDTASFVSGAYTAGWALSASAATSITFIPSSASYANSASAGGQFFAIGHTGSFTGSVSGNLLGTASIANSASFVSASYVAGWSVTSNTASFVSGAYTAQWARTTDTASFVSGAYTAQWAKIADSSSFVSGAYTSQWALTSSFAQTASYAKSGPATCITLYNGTFGGNTLMTNISGVLVEWNVSQRTLADLTDYSSYKVVVEVVSGSLNGTSNLSVQYATTPLQNSWSFFGSQSGVPLYVTGVATSSYAPMPAVAAADNIYLRWVTWSGSLSQARIGTINLWVK